METTPNFSLPYIMPAQAQKHITYNEALRMLDAMVNLSASAELSDPPVEPEDGERFIIGQAATGAWAGKSGKIAARQDGDWSYFEPKAGWRCYVVAAAKLLIFDGTGWTDLLPPEAPLQNIDVFGVRATADAQNRLTVSSPGTLLTHEGSDHRLVVNKAAATDTASLVFQSSWIGHAQFGLSGDTDFRINVSADGETWNDAIVADAATGQVSFPSGLANPQLHGTPDNFTGFDRLYIDAVNGDDANDGRSKTTALKTAAGLAARFTVGRRLELRLLTDIVFDHVIQIGYVVPQLDIFGRNADDTDWENRTITVVDSTNFTNHPGSFMFRSFASVYTFRINVELATSKAYALLNFYNTIGFLRTHTMTLTRTGAGSCSLFSNGASFVPSSHTGLTIGAGAGGYVAKGVAAGANPNDDWRYPSNVTSFSEA